MPGGFLATVVGFADALAHTTADALGVLTGSYEEWPEWQQLMRFDPVHGMELDTQRERAEAEADLVVLGG